MTAATGQSFRGTALRYAAWRVLILVLFAVAVQLIYETGICKVFWCWLYWVLCRMHWTDIDHRPLLNTRAT